MAISQTEKPKRAKRTHRINLRALAYSGGLLVLIVVLYFPLKMLSEQRARSSALAQARESAAKGDVDLALRHLNRYLVSWPNDILALEEKTKLVSDSAHQANQILEAANLNDQLIRLDPSGPNRRETRRKLAELYIRYSDEARNFATQNPDQAKAAMETRYIAAIEVARQLVKDDKNDGAAHRLLAMALDGQLATGDVKAALIGKQLAEAEEEYREALRLDPRDLIASERLANLYYDRLKEPARAETTLQEMLKANPDSVQVRLARSRVYRRAKDNAKSRAELDAALALAPNDALIRLDAANESLSRHDTADARRQLDAIPADQQNQLRVRYLRGVLENSEQHPDDAIEEWRKGLSLAGGTDVELTWSLASILIQLGRLGEAKPLVAQFQRLEKDESLGLGRYLKAMFERASGRPALAVKELERIQDRVPTLMKPDVQLLLGRCYEEVGDESRALLAYRRASTLLPRATNPRRMISRILQTRDPEQAIGELERALTQSPDDLTLLTDIIRLRIFQQQALPVAQRNWREVIDLLDRAGKLAPNDSSVRSLRAMYLAAADRLAEAVDLLGQATRGPDRKRPETWLNWVIGLVRMNRTDEALQALEKASTPEEAGDHASLRIARARLLARTGKGLAARDLLSKNRETIPASERPELSRELGELLQLMGDRDGARIALAEWARLVPDSPRPALTLLNLAQVNSDDEAARLGLEALRRLGGDQESYGLAAEAMERLRADRSKPAPLSPERLDEAERLVSRLEAEAPHLAVGHLLKGMILEQRGKLEEAATAYRRAMKDDGTSPAMPRLVEILTRLKRFDELDAMKRRLEEQALERGQSVALAEFDRISAVVAMRSGDTDRAEFHAAQLVEAQPDNVQARVTQAQILERGGKTKEAEATLQALVDRKPKVPDAWLALVAFQVPRRPQAEVFKTIEKVRTNYKGDRPELLIAQCHWLANDKPNLERLFYEALTKQPNDPVTLRAVAEFDEATGRIEHEETVLRTVLKINPKESWAARALALLISARGDSSTWDEAWALIAPGAPGSGEAPEDRLARATLLARSPVNARRAEAIPAFIALANDLPASNPQGLEVRLRLAQAMLESNRPADAWSFIAPVADDLNRPTPAALAIAVEALVLTGKPEEAERRLDRLQTLEPKSLRTAWANAWVQQAKGKKADASATIESAFTNALSTPDAEPVAVNSVDLLLKFGDSEAAGRVAKQAAARSPRLAWLLARVQSSLQDYDGALNSCRVALEAGSSREVVRYATGAAIARRSDPKFLKEVEHIGVEARAKAPKDLNILIFLATVYHLQDRYEEEVALYREVLGLNPPNVQFLNNMAWTLCEGLHQFDEAMARIEEAIRREGVNAEYLDTRGVIRDRLGMKDQAIADLELSVKIIPSPTTYFHLARAYLKAGRPDQSRRCRDLAIQAKFDASTLDPTDRADMEAVMAKP